MAHDICEQMKEHLIDAPWGLPVAIGALPDKPEEIGVLRQRWSTKIDQYFGMNERTFIPLITLTVRTTSYVKGASQIDIAQALLSDIRVGEYDVFVTGMWAYIGKDQKNRHIFQVNFKIVVRE